MRKTLIAAATVAVAAGLLVPGSVANAAEASQTVEFTVAAAAGGGLSVGTGGPASALTLAGQGGEVTGSLTVFRVTDNRGGTEGWNASIALSDFVNQTDNSYVIPASNATYKANPVAGLVFGGEAITHAVTLKNEPTVVVQRTNHTIGSPLEVATWTNVNSMKVQIPAEVAVGAYKSTLTLSAI